MRFIKIRMHNRKYKTGEGDYINFNQVLRFETLDGGLLRIYMTSGTLYLIEGENGAIERILTSH